jgi:hypothetical protein
MTMINSWFKVSDYLQFRIATEVNGILQSMKKKLK